MTTILNEIVQQTATDSGERIYLMKYRNAFMTKADYSVLVDGICKGETTIRRQAETLYQTWVEICNER